MTEYPWGCDFFVETGRMMPVDGCERLRDSDAILLGAVGRPDVPDHVSLWGLLIPIRRTFRQYVNLRPVRLWRGIDSPRSGRICSATTSNGIIHTMPFWDERFAAATAQHPELKAELMLIDALAAR